MDFSCKWLWDVKTWNEIVTGYRYVPLCFVLFFFFKITLHFSHQFMHTEFKLCSVNFFNCEPNEQTKCGQVSFLFFFSHMMTSNIYFLNLGWTVKSYINVRTFVALNYIWQILHIFFTCSQCQRDPNYIKSYICRTVENSNQRDGCG